MSEAFYNLTSDRPAVRRRSWRPDGLTMAALVVAALLSIPVVTVFVHVVVPSEGTLAHLADTVLPLYVMNTLLLVVGVGTGVLLLGVSTAWLVTMCSFPGQRLFEWALIL